MTPPEAIVVVAFVLQIGCLIASLILQRRARQYRDEAHKVYADANRAYEGAQGLLEIAERSAMHVNLDESSLRH